MPLTPLKAPYNLYRYIQHLILESEFKYDDDDLKTILMRLIGHYRQEENI